MSDEPKRGHAGRFLPGHTANRRGRPKGSLNATTVLANRRLLAHADKAVRRLVRCLDSKNEWLALAAAKTIVERAATTAPESASDSSWVNHLTADETRQLYRLLKAAKERMPCASNEMAELPGWHGTREQRDDAARYGDSFISLPAPRAAEPTPADEDELVIDVAASEVPK